MNCRTHTLKEGIFIAGFTDQDIGREGACQQTFDNFVPTWIECFVGRYVIIHPLAIPPSEEV